MQLCPTLDISLSVARNHRRKNARVARSQKKKRGPTVAQKLVLSRQNRRLWAGTFSRTLVFERMTCDGRTACRALGYERGRVLHAVGRSSAGVFLMAAAPAARS
jgi:hypothetical protein